jgi:hypothetical protein
MKKKRWRTNGNNETNGKISGLEFFRLFRYFRLFRLLFFIRFSMRC